jgi:endoglucanase
MYSVNCNIIGRFAFMDKNKIKEICQIYGPSSAEGSVSSYIINEIKDYADDYEIDTLGNLIAHKKGNGPKMMLAAHMDQIGLMVNFVDDDGFLRFSTIGGFSPYVLFNQRVRFENGVQGVIHCERLQDMAKDLAIDKLYIDIGAKNKEEAEKLVRAGDICVYSAETYFNGDVVVSPALDDRIGCYIQMETLKQLKNPAYDTYFVFTVQEEVGLRGAKTSAYAVDPDYGIAYDVTLAYDTPNALKFPMKMGEGAAIKIKDNSLICHPTIVKHMEKVAKENNIKHQFEILTAGGTDSGAIHLTKSGVPSGVISVVTRHIHSDSEMCSLEDIKACIDLSVKVLETPMN